MLILHRPPSPRPPSPPQKYRHVDNIMFENHTIADRFLDFWRKTGSQRMGYLYGRYTEHKDIPLGIRAEVAAIYEPPQVRLPLGGRARAPRCEGAVRSFGHQRPVCTFSRWLSGLLMVFLVV